MLTKCQVSAKGYKYHNYSASLMSCFNTDWFERQSYRDRQKYFICCSLHKWFLQSGLGQAETIQVSHVG